MVHKGNKHLGDYFSSSREKGIDGLPLFSVTLHDGLVLRSEFERKTETNITPDKHLLVRQGDIAYNMMRVWQGALGRADIDGIVSPAYIVLRPNKHIDSRFAEYLFNTSRMIYLFWAYSYGLTKDRLRLYFNDFKRIPAEIIPQTEQKKIAKMLSTWDRAIEVTEKQLANSQQQKKSLMQQLFTGKKRLPGFDRAWNRIFLSKIADITMGSSPKSEAYNSLKEGLPLLQGNADIKKKLSAPRVYTSQITKECLVGDILLSVRAPVGEISRSVHHACIGRGIAAIRAGEDVSQNYLYQWLLHFEPKWIRFSQGSTFEAVNSNDIKTLHIDVPQKEEQQNIASVLTNADKEVETLQQKLDCLHQEKKALMQQLLTGKRRVKVDDGDQHGEGA